MMLLTRRALLLSTALVVLPACDAEPGPGAPRAPLPSEIKGPPQPAGPMPTPRSLPEIRKELAAKKAKEEADKAAAESKASKPPGAAETPKPADAAATPPKEKAAETPKPADPAATPSKDTAPGAGTQNQ
ncbi:MAG: hypothetical protein ACLQGP_38345 [Isosphaeraceae bacterium]